MHRPHLVMKSLRSKSIRKLWSVSPSFVKKKSWWSLDHFGNFPGNFGFSWKLKITVCTPHIVILPSGASSQNPLENRFLNSIWRELSIDFTRKHRLRSTALLIYEDPIFQENSVQAEQCVVIPRKHVPVISWWIPKEFQKNIRRFLNNLREEHLHNTWIFLESRCIQEYSF